MVRSTLGKPRVKESKGARQARLLRALEHRVRRLEKQQRADVICSGAPGHIDLERVQLFLDSPPAMAFAGASRAGPRLPFTLVDIDDELARIQGVLDQNLRDALHALNSRRTRDTFAIHTRWVDEAELRRMYPGHPWYRRTARALHWFFLVLPRRALGAVTPSYGVREAGPSLSDDTQ